MEAEKLFFVIVNIGGHPVIKQHWTNIAGYSDNVRGEKVLDRLETFIFLNPITCKRVHIKNLITIEILFDPFD
jgi:hypothetical protein